LAAFFDLPPDLAPLSGLIARGLERVVDRFDEQLRSDLPPIARLVRHVERYRGKMLRPTLVLVGGLATHPLAQPQGASADPDALITDAHITLGAVCEMVHMATLVHDDVLDEAETRRRGQTVNRLYGNEPAVMLGDYLIAASYRLCSTLPTPEAARAVAEAAVVTASGELLQLHHRDDLSLDEPTYFEIVRRKTGVLIATSCRLGGWASGASPAALHALETFGTETGIAFQIQDDVLDLTGSESTVGKSVGKDLEKGKLTLPLLLHLSASQGADRAEFLSLLDQACGSGPARQSAADRIARLVADSGALERAREEARRRIGLAKSALATLPPTGARRLLELMADAVVTRAF
jgi:octaprenyl-diphosphate synthase